MKKKEKKRLKKKAPFAKRAKIDTHSVLTSTNSRVARLSFLFAPRTEMATLAKAPAASASSSSSSSSEHFDLSAHFEQTNCLNEDASRPHTNLFLAEGGGVCESDADEQLLLRVVFKSPPQPDADIVLWRALLREATLRTIAESLTGPGAEQ